MNAIPAGERPLDSAERQARRKIGIPARRALGLVHAAAAAEFARAAGETSPRLADPGHPRFLVHPMYVVSLLRGAGGGGDEEFRPDGMYRDEVPGTDGLDLLLMAGGQEVRWLGEAAPGDTVEVIRRLRSVQRKDGRSGSFLMLTVDKAYQVAGRGGLAQVSEIFLVRDVAPAAVRPDAAPQPDAARQPDAEPGPVTLSRPEATLAPDEVRLLRFGAATRNAHRIHYDTEFARSQGLTRPVVMAQLHGCLLFQAAAARAGDPAAVRALGWRNQAPAHPGDRLTVTVTAANPEDPDPGAANPGTRLELAEHGAGGTVCCTGYALLGLQPAHDDRAGPAITRPTPGSR